MHNNNQTTSTTVITKNESVATPQNTPCLTNKQQSCFKSIFVTFLHIVCITIGTGIFSLPYVIKSIGWFGLLILAAVAVICYYTGTLMIKCLYANPGKRLSTLSEVADYAFGRKGYLISQTAVYSDILGVAWIYIILSVENFQTILENFKAHVPSEILYPMIGFIILVPFVAFKEIKESSFLSFLGFLTTAIAGVVVLVFSVKGIYEVPKHSATYAQATKIPLLELASLPFAFAQFSFAFGGAVVFPQAEASMTHKSKFQLSLLISILFIFFAYLITSTLSLIAFKDVEIKDLIYKNLDPSSLPVQLSLVAMTLHYLAATPIYLSIISVEVEGYIRKQYHLDNSNEFVQRTIFRTGLVGALTSISFLTSRFKVASGLVGSFASCLIIFMIPCACYLKLFCNPKRLKEFGLTKLVAISFILICGVFCFCAGISTTIASEIKAQTKQ